MGRKESNQTKTKSRSNKIALKRRDEFNNMICISSVEDIWDQNPKLISIRPHQASEWEENQQNLDRQKDKIPNETSKQTVQTNEKHKERYICQKVHV